MLDLPALLALLDLPAAAAPSAPVLIRGGTTLELAGPDDLCFAGTADLRAAVQWPELLRSVRRQARALAALTARLEALERGGGAAPAAGAEEGSP